MLKKNIFDTFKMWIYMSVIIIIYILCIVLKSDISFVDAGTFYIYISFGIPITGMAILFLLKMKVLSSIELYAYSFLLGYILTIINYFLCVPFGLKGYMPTLAIIEVFISVIYLIKRRKTFDAVKSDQSGMIICALFIIGMLFIRFFLYFGNYILPYEGRINATPIWADILFHFENTVEASIEFPMKNFRWLSETNYKYHYFSNIQMASVKLVTGIDTYHLEAYLGYIQPVILLCTGFYLLLNHLKANKIMKLLTFIALFFSSPVVSSGIYWNGHIYVTPFGLDTGIALMIFTMFFFVKQIQNDKFKIVDFCIILTLFSATLGSKGPCGLVLLFGMGMVCFGWLFKGKSKMAWGYGIGLLLVFIIVYFGFVSDVGTTVGDSANSLKIGIWPAGIQKMDFWGKSYRVIERIGLPIVISQLLTTVVWVLSAAPALFPLFFILIIYCIFFLHRIEPEETLMISSALLGLLLMVISDHAGNSHTYFVMASYPFAAAFVGKKATEIYDDLGKLKSIALVVWGIGILIGIYQFVIYAEPIFKNGYNNIMCYNNENDIPDIGIPNTLRQDECRAYDWLRENTDEDTLFVTNILLLDEAGRNMIMGVLAERHVWLDGWTFAYDKKDEAISKREILFELYGGNIDAYNYLEEAGVTYIVEIKEVQDRLKLTSDLDNKIFENNSVNIYRME